MAKNLDTRVTQLEQQVTPPGKMPSLADILRRIKEDDDAAFEDAGADVDEQDDDPRADESQDDQPGGQRYSLANVIRQIETKKRLH